MDRSKQLGEGSIPRLLLRFSAPAIVGMMAQALYNLVDRIFVGHAIGQEGIAGTTVAFPFMLIGLAFCMLVRFGAATLVSIRLGQRKVEEAEQVLGNAVVLLLGVALLLGSTGLLLLDPFLRLSGASEDILPYAHDYLQIIVLGSAFQAIGFGLNALIRAEGNPRIAMTTMLIGAALNTILNPIFLFGFGWGMRGAAAATILAQAVSAIWVLSYFLRGKSLLKLRSRNMRPSRPVCVSIITTGSPPFAMQMAASVMNILLNHQLRGHGGDLAISVMGIIHIVALFFVMPIFGINQGAQPIIGYNLGAKKFDRVKKTLQCAILAATTICIAGFFVVMIWPATVIGLFNREDVELIRLGTHAIRICLVMFPIVGFQIVSSGYFQAVGKPKHALFLGLSRQILLLIPAILILPYFFGLDGIWIAIPAADLVASILTGIWLFLELRHLRAKHAEVVNETGEKEAFAENG